MTRTKVRRIVAVTGVLMLTACVSLLGLEADKYVSYEEQFCLQYATLCNPHAVTYGIPLDKQACVMWVKEQLAKPPSDPTHPNFNDYANLHCRSTTTCADFLDCVAGAHFIPSPSTCGATNCVGNAATEAGAPWRCCPGDQCFDREDASGCLTTSQWQCVGKVVFPKMDFSDAGNVDIAVSFKDINSNALVNNLTVVACGRLDLECASPITEMTPTGMNPHSFRLPFAFDGYLLATPDADGGDLEYMPGLVFLVPPLTADTAKMLSSGPIPLFKRQAFNNIGIGLGVPIDPDAGSIFSFAFDCSPTPTYAAGVTADLDTDAGRILFFSNNQPALSRSETDNGGQLGFVNVPTGLRVLNTRVHGVRTASAVIFVRPGGLTFVPMPPSP